MNEWIIWQYLHDHFEVSIVIETVLVDRFRSSVGLQKFRIQKLDFINVFKDLPANGIEHWNTGYFVICVANWTHLRHRSRHITWLPATCLSLTRAVAPLTGVDCTDPPIVSADLVEGTGWRTVCHGRQVKGGGGRRPRRSGQFWRGSALCAAVPQPWTHVLRKPPRTCNSFRGLEAKSLLVPLLSTFNGQGCDQRR